MPKVRQKKVSEAAEYSFIVYVFSLPVFTSNYPVRTCYQAAKLPLGAAVEIEIIALTGDVKVEHVNVD